MYATTKQEIYRKRLNVTSENSARLFIRFVRIKFSNFIKIPLTFVEIGGNGIWILQVTI